MAYIKERGNNNYFVRVSCGILDNGRPFQKSRLFRPSRVNLQNQRFVRNSTLLSRLLRKSVESSLKPNVNPKPISNYPKANPNINPWRNKLRAIINQ